MRDSFMRRLMSLPISVLTETRAKEITPDGAIVERNGDEIAIAGCSKVILEGAETLAPEVLDW